MNRASQRVTSEAVKGQVELAICLLAFTLKCLLDEEGAEALKTVNDGPDSGDLPEPKSGESSEEPRVVEGDGDDLMAGGINGIIDEGLEEVNCLLEMEANEEQCRACDLNILQQRWSRHFESYSDDSTRGRWVGGPPLGIALDSPPSLGGEPSQLYDRGEGMDIQSYEFPYKLAHDLVSQFEGEKLMVLLLGDQVCTAESLGDPVNGSVCDQFVGLILLSRIHDGVQHWQRVGVCQWRSYLRKHISGFGDFHTDILLARAHSGWSWRGFLDNMKRAWMAKLWL